MDTPQVVTPVEFKNSNPSETTGDLESAIQNSLQKIKHCEEQANLWLKKRDELQNKLNEALDKIKKQVSNNNTNKKQIKVDKDSSIPDLIRSFLEKNGPARTKDIRKYLLSQGRNTGPGVALGRLVRDGSVKSVERGVYKIS